MRGHHAYNHPAFDRAAAKLRKLGHVVFSPAEQDRIKWPDRPWASYVGDPVVDGITQADLRTIIKPDLVWICDHAEMLFILLNWRNSKGVAVEIALANFLNLPIEYEVY
jgi:hypothetical protein